MTTEIVELSNVVYNPANQSFEALVTIHQGTTSRKIACAIDAPISMTFEDAASGLSTHAMRRFYSDNGLSSHFIAGPIAPQRAGRPVPRRMFKTFAMLRKLAA